MANSTSAHPQARPRTTAPGELRARTRTQVVSFLQSERFLILVLMAAGLVAHGLNMFHYPSFTLKDDEGQYAQMAWAVLREHRLAPYTYYYAHAPAGWILVALWTWLSGGLHTFGGAIDSGRMLMLLLHVAMVPLLYRVTRKLGANAPAAAFATLIFSLSPLAVFYQRLLLLDNIMLFWILLSLDLLLDGWGRLSRAVLSGICFGLALLSKETGIFLLPAMLFIAFQQRWRHQGRFRFGAWLLPMMAVASWYPLFALLKGELLPAGLVLRFHLFNIPLSPEHHVSLLEALTWQASRGGGGILNLDNQFWQFMRKNWFPRDPLLLIGGIVAVALNLLWGIRNRRALAAALLGLLPMLYMARGGIVLEFYILFAIPFLCLNLALLLSPLLRRLPAWAGGLIVVGLLAGMVGFYWNSGKLLPLYTEQPDQAGREALAWIKQNVPADSMMIGRDDLWTDLHEPGLGGAAFPNYHSHWKIAGDDDVRKRIFQSNWHTVDYLVISPGLKDAFTQLQEKLSLDALANAHLVKRWASDPGSDQQSHPGQFVELWKVDKVGATETTLLNNSAAYLASRFEHGGAYVEPDGKVTSESQAYAMLRTVWSGDRDGFYRAWHWTQAHLAEDNGLLQWKWQNGSVVDAHTASDADTDAALALLLASKRWNDPALLDAGQRMVRAIWEREVVTVNGTPYLAAGDWATTARVVTLNPSYFSPYAYHIFQEIDHDHNWLSLVDSSYQVLFDASKASLGATKSAGLPPDWIGLDRTSGQLVPLQLDKGDTTRYSYDAARTYWRVALHLRWTNDGRANTFLAHTNFLRDEVKRKGLVSAAYARDGAVVEQSPSMVGTAGALAALLPHASDTANTLYASQIVGSANRAGNSVYWGDANDLYTQEWGWFGTALYANALPDLWHAQ